MSVEIATAHFRTLHRIHRQLADLSHRADRGPRLVAAHEAKLKAAQEQLATLEQQEKDLRAKADRKQLDLSSGESAVQKRRLQMREAKDNREYKALQDQIAADEKVNSVYAEEALELMEECDTFQSVVAEARQAVDKARDELAAIQERVSGEGPRLEQDIERLRSELAEAERTMPSDCKDLYRRLVRKQGEEALAPVMDGSCGGCHQRLPVNMINNLMLNKPTTCRSCGRLLYLPENFQLP